MNTARPPIAHHPLLLGAVLVFLALNTRFALAAIPPVLEHLRLDTGLSSTGAGLLTSAPVLCFAAAAPLAAVLARRVGQELLLALCAVATAVGIAIRSLPDLGALFGGTVALGVAIAIANVLMPSVIKRWFPRPGAMMGLYTTCLSFSAAIAAASTIPLEQLFGSWRWALAAWALPALAAAAMWLPATLAAGTKPAPSAGPPVSLWRDRTAWIVTITFGLQSFLFYGMLTWLPDMLSDAGLTAADAGAMLSIALLLGAPASLVLPVVMVRHPRRAAVVSPAFWAAGLVGVLLVPATFTEAWMVLLGIGQGAGIAFSLTLVVLRTTDAVRAAALSGMAQGAGFAIAAMGPIVLGAVRDLAGAWDDALLIMICATVLFVVSSLAAAVAAPSVGAATRTRTRCSA